MKKEKILLVKNIGKTVAIMGAATVLSLFLQNLSPEGNQVPLIYVLAVLFVSRFTDGYVYGIVASALAVAFVNYVFTYPYFEINFNLTGYPITFAVMLAVACSVSALTTQIKQQEKIRLEIEREKLRANILRGVSHDIRTPLTSIVGSASGLIENYDVLDKEKQLGLVEDIRDDAQWLIRMVENLLSVTRIGGSKGALELSEELAEEIIGSAVEKFQKRFPTPPVSVVLPEEVIMIPMQGILIEQVLVNLMENAVIHGKGTTEITVRLLTEEDRVVFWVEDNGAGIRPEVLPKIFDGQMESASGSESDSKRNMGIGLSVCKSIVAAHKGNMMAENRETGGARIGFWLPKGEE